MHVLPGYAPDLNPDEWVWSHVKHTGVARTPLRAGEKLSVCVEEQLRGVRKTGSWCAHSSRLHLSLIFRTGE